jgi:hypothetical protein
MSKGDQQGTMLNKIGNGKIFFIDCETRNQNEIQQLLNNIQPYVINVKNDFCWTLYSGEGYYLEFTEKLIWLESLGFNIKYQMI